MDVVVRLADEALMVIGTIASVYLAVGIVTAFVEGQFASMTDRPGVKALLFERIALLALCVTVVAFARPVARQVASVLQSTAGDAGSIRGALLELGAYFADIMIGLVVILMAVGIAMGFVDAQLKTVLGEAQGLSLAMYKVAAVVLLGIGGLMGMTIARIIVDAVK